MEDPWKKYSFSHSDPYFQHYREYKHKQKILESTKHKTTFIWQQRLIYQHSNVGFKTWMADCGWVTTCVDVQKSWDTSWNSCDASWNSCDAPWDNVLLKFQRQWAKTKCDERVSTVDYKVWFLQSTTRCCCAPRDRGQCKEQLSGTRGHMEVSDFTLTDLKNYWLNLEGNIFFKWYSIFLKRWISMCSS